MMVQREIYPRYQHPPHCSHNAWSDDETDDGGKVVGWEGAACFRLVAGDHDLHQQHLITNTAEEFSWRSLSTTRTRWENANFPRWYVY